MKIIRTEDLLNEDWESDVYFDEENSFCIDLKNDLTFKVPNAYINSITFGMLDSESGDTETVRMEGCHSFVCGENDSEENSDDA